MVTGVQVVLNRTPGQRRLLRSGKLAVLVIGVIVLLMGVVFALQGANVIGGSSLMSGNSEYIYIGGVVAVIGLVIIALSSRVGRPPVAVQGSPQAPS